MSNFTNDELKDLFKDNLEALNMFVATAQEKKIDIEISILKSGLISVSSKEWDESDPQKNILYKHTVEWGKDRKTESTDVFYYNK